ncbi:MULTISPECIES: type III secretion protein [unclassified Pseudomonas]|uniref:type III secretion protein n=1 Tax=unclassified Pseudomonas TaxID=196821 RepID=UPI001F1E8CAE|nr:MULTISPECIES: type III secretion protein [unclassified Pseudomonas]
MHTDRLNNASPASAAVQGPAMPREASTARDLADALGQHLTHHAGGHRLKEALMHASADHDGPGLRPSPGGHAAQQEVTGGGQNPLHLVLTDMLEEINGGTGQNLEVDIDDAYDDEDLLGDLAHLFAQRRPPLGDNHIGSQSDFDSASNPFCGALFGAWESAVTGDRRRARLRLLLKLIALLGRRTLRRLLEVDDQAGLAHYAAHDHDLMFEVARFMDRHPQRYPPPAQRHDSAPSWTERVADGTPLCARQTHLFQLALERLDLALARLAGQAPLARRRGRRVGEDVEFHLSLTGSARNVLRLMCA